MVEQIRSVKVSLFGKGSIHDLGIESRKLGVHRALIITDRFLFENGMANKVGQSLLDAGLEYAVYYNVQPNPTVDVVIDCLDAVQTLGVDFLVALGGGSAIDTAKAVSVVATNGGRVEDYEGVNRSHSPGLPIAAVNTTAGTGSECTIFYIITDPNRHSKMAMVDQNCMVAISVNDIDFMMSMPPDLTANTGMDALTHSIEAVLSTKATPLTDKDALWSMAMIAQNLQRAFDNGTDEEARTMMAYAANVAGAAFSNAGLGMVHAMAHALGGYYNLTHGLCNAVLLPYVMTFNCMDAHVKHKFADIAQALQITDCSAEDAAIYVIQRLFEMNRGLRIPQSLRELNSVDPKDFDTLAELALHDTCMSTNPIQPSKEDVKYLYRLAYNGLASACTQSEPSSSYNDFNNRGNVMNTNKVVMAGTGIMGASLCQVYALAGYETWGYDAFEAGIENGKHLIALNQETMVKEGLITQEESDAAVARIHFTQDKEVFRDCCLVVESTVERMDIKQNFFREISEIAPKEALLCTNTSGLHITEIAEACKYPERFMGQHWLNPPHLLPLCEIIAGTKTSEENILKMRKLVESLGKQPVVVGDINGFIINRIQFAVLREALHIVEMGAATYEDVDTVLKAGMGLRYAVLGPFGIADHGGIHTFDHITSYLNADLADEKVESPVLKKMVEEGKLGVKSGAGFYDYSGDKADEAIRERDRMYIELAKVLYFNNKK